MGILADFETAIEKANPAQLVADVNSVKAKVLDYETRISSLESVVVQLKPAIQSVIALLPGGSLPAELTALLALLPKPQAT